MITQTRYSRHCGQSCLAKLSGMPLVAAKMAVGHKRGTTREDIVRAAKLLRLDPVGDWRIGDNNHWISWHLLPETGNCILAVRRERQYRRWHWICRVDGVLWDPSSEEPGVSLHREDYVLMDFLCFEKRSHDE